MGMAWFVSMLLNIGLIALPIVLLLVLAMVLTWRAQRTTFWTYLPRTVAASIVLATFQLALLAQSLKETGVYALFNFATITFRPGLILLPLAACFALFLGASQWVGARRGNLLRHGAICLLLAGTIQCTIAFLAIEPYFQYFGISQRH
jgi:hypothetical protein